MHPLGFSPSVRRPLPRHRKAVGISFRSQSYVREPRLVFSNHNALTWMLMLGFSERRRVERAIESVSDRAKTKIDASKYSAHTCTLRYTLKLGL